MCMCVCEVILFSCGVRLGGSILNVCARKHTDLVACASSDVLLCDVVMMYMCCVHVVRVCVHICVCT